MRINVHSIRACAMGVVQCLLLWSCSTTKFVPEGQYLLNKVKIQAVSPVNAASDSTAPATMLRHEPYDPSELKGYLRQTPNSEILGFWKLQLQIYNTAPTDTSTVHKKRLARNAHRVGEAPEIYDSEKTGMSLYHLQKAMQNKGYFNATVDTMIRIKKRKLDLTYLVDAGTPYTLRHCAYELPHPALHDVATNTRRSLLQEGMLFDADVLNEERKRIESDMRNYGYYFFEKEMLRYSADSAAGNHQVDATLSLQPYVMNTQDSAYQNVFRIYTIRHVYFSTDYDPAFAPDSTKLITETDGDYIFIYYGTKLLRNKVLIRNTRIRPGDVYNQRKVDRTYEILNGLGAIKYVDISFERVGTSELDCHVVLSRQKLHTVSAQIEGTYTGGDWGVAAEVGYANRNIFQGSEEFSIKARGGYEWRQNGGRAIEAKLNAGLKFPNQLKIELEGRYQDRPDEYNRIIANAALNYHYQKNPISPWSHYFRFVDISYVYLPWIADEFRKTFLQSTNLLKYSYENHFIFSLGYQVNYTSYHAKHPYRSYGTFSLSAETAGNTLQALSKLAKASTNEDGKYKIGNILFSQYAKLDFSFTGHHIINENHRFVYRGAIGVAIPYGNSNAIPFEKRYYAGGANGVRGWTARSLGPGTYRGTGSQINYDNQAGDVRLDLSAEYRVRIWKFIHAAAFVDAGNIWTIRKYEAQKDGEFLWSEFYKQIGLSYGCGLRLDLSFLILRFDLGVRLHDPARIEEGKQWRTVANGLSWSNDCAFHFAIGYPF